MGNKTYSKNWAIPHPHFQKTLFFRYFYPQKTGNSLRPVAKKTCDYPAVIVEYIPEKPARGVIVPG
jgi:hypothetical protein